MRPLIVVITVPLLGYPFHFLYASEDVRVKYSPSVTAIEPFYISVLCRTSRLGIQNAYVVPFAPFLEILWNELRAVIASDVFRLAVQLDHLFQCLYHPSCRERHWNLLGHRHLITVIHYVQHSELPSALQDITNKIQRPCRIGFGGLFQRCLDPCRKAFLQTDTFLVVHILVPTVNLLVVPILSFTPETFEYLPESVSVLGCCPYRFFNFSVISLLLIIVIPISSWTAVIHKFNRGHSGLKISCK